MTSQLSVAFATWWVIDVLAYFITCYLWVFVQPGTGRRPVDWCMNQMAALYPDTAKSACCNTGL